MMSKKEASTLDLSLTGLGLGGSKWRHDLFISSSSPPKKETALDSSPSSHDLLEH